MMEAIEGREDWRDHVTKHGQTSSPQAQIYSPNGSRLVLIACNYQYLHNSKQKQRCWVEVAMLASLEVDKVSWTARIENALWIRVSHDYWAYHLSRNLKAFPKVLSTHKFPNIWCAFLSSWWVWVTKYKPSIHIPLCIPPSQPNTYTHTKKTHRHGKKTPGKFTASLPTFTNISYNESAQATFMK